MPLGCSMPKESFIGQKFGKLTILERSLDPSISFGKSKSKSSKWLCLCECGNKIITTKQKLKQKDRTNCGCTKIKWSGRSNTKNRKYSPEESLLRQYYSKYHYGAVKRNYIFDVSFDDFLKLIKSNCYYCGDAPSKELGYGKDKKYNLIHIVNGIDRLDNSIGYKTENLVSCCKECNVMKLNLTLECFIDKIHKISKLYKERMNFKNEE